ncbi:hypothetical protein EHS25_008922 [Saitozyma podzolica]|uniref:Uncharacterized protein n=1 Tax=Saitozyma podzolica TaxID=1890683 RepID=A0A427YN55_9TREE|nr:hypothetical protein EHS25_008922 [Saitozyma podzolica]
MASARLLSVKDEAALQVAFEQYLGTSTHSMQTHVPFAALHLRPHTPGVRVDTGLPDPLDTGIPRNPRVASDTVLKLAGIKSY